MSNIPDPVEIAQGLIRINSINPPGGEEAAARYVGEIMAKAGLKVDYAFLDNKRAGVVARLAGNKSEPVLVYTGHLDTVPLGTAQWSFDPHGGEIKNGCLLGRGASDMKSGIAAMTAAAIQLAAEPAGCGDIIFAFTAGEETGCDGAWQMVNTSTVPGKAEALVVAEPSGMEPFLGHKGALWLECSARGKSAHGSMPDKGDNAIYKAARAAAGLEDFFADPPAHPQLGKPTINVGTFSGGSKINMVPDQATFQVDLRTVPGMDHGQLTDEIRHRMGQDITVKQLIDLPGFLTPADDPWITSVMQIMQRFQGAQPSPGYVNFFTDASVLKPALGDPPTIVLGPGDPGQAHQTDEFCPVDQIRQAAKMYVEIALEWWRG